MKQDDLEYSNKLITTMEVKIKVKIFPKSKTQGRFYFPQTEMQGTYNSNCVTGINIDQ